MRQSSRIFDEQVSWCYFGVIFLPTYFQVEDLNYEKRKTDGLLQQLLPVDIIAQLKAGEQPPPKCCINLYLAPAQLTTYHFFNFISFYQIPGEKESSYPMGQNIASDVQDV